MDTLIFNQQANKNGTCECIFNGQVIDHCDMNWEDKYTQAHVVVANLIKTLGHGNFEIKINESKEIANTVGIYPIGQIVEMAGYLKGMPMVRQYSLKSAQG